jgi:hypothetical protein
LEWSGGIEIIALYTDGTVKWRKGVGPLFSSPAIGSDGTVYVGTEQNDNGYLVAFGKSDSNYPPDKPDIDVPSRWPVGVELCITFNSTDPDNNTIGYIIDWGDGTINETIYYESGELIEICHTWEKIGIYTIKVQAIDLYGESSGWSVFKIEVPRTRATTYLWYHWFLERFPMLERLLEWIR